MEKKDYYAILGVNKDASTDEIKSSYRKLAREWHPDKWVGGSEEEKAQAEEKFKEISEAYEVLSDAEKRNRYDNGGDDFDFSGFDPMEMFKTFFGGSTGGFGGFDFFGERMPRVNKGRTLSARVNLSLSEAYNGVKKEINVIDYTPCPHCKGSGKISQVRQTAPNTFINTVVMCPHCKGSGVMESSGVERTVEVNIPKGVYDGCAITYSGLGSKPDGNGENGDLNVIVNIAPDPYFVRPDVINLVHYENVPFNECLLGFEKEFQCIDGSIVKVKAPELTPHGKAFIFNGKGMPNPNRPNMRGDYAVVINYELPSKLTKEQKDKLKNF